MKGLVKRIGQLNQAAYADTEIKLDAVTEPERLQYSQWSQRACKQSHQTIVRKGH
jgi:hypothetical protein